MPQFSEELFVRVLRADVFENADLGLAISSICFDKSGELQEF
tara:strand:+ start:738 stop:863 length:126 start_codon:yes stop_codon:yes gene_type:complete